MINIYQEVVKIYSAKYYNGRKSHFLSSTLKSAANIYKKSDPNPITSIQKKKRYVIMHIIIPPRMVLKPYVSTEEKFPNPN